MKKRNIFLLGLSMSVVLQAMGAGDRLWDKFINPSSENKTKVWWFHGETESTKEGVDADLEAFREKGLGGVVYYDQVHGSAEGAFESMSPQWWSIIRYAARKAKELGLTFEVAASNGYVAGGPWITEELGMKQTAFTDTLLFPNRDGFIEAVIPKPSPKFRDVVTVMFSDNEEFNERPFVTPVRMLKDNETAEMVMDAGKEIVVSAISYYTGPRGKGSMGSMNLPGKPADRFYGAGYVDLPPIGDLEYSRDGVTWSNASELTGVENIIGHKSNRRTISFPSVKGRYFRIVLHDWMDGSGRFNELKFWSPVLYTRDMTHNIEVKSGLRTEVTYPSAEGGNRGAVRRNDLRDVSAWRHGDTLRVKAGQGPWRVIRLGFEPTGAKTKHGRRNLLGLEADIMSAKAAKAHFDNYFKVILDTLRADGCPPVGTVLDSHEAGIQNWTEGFENTLSEKAGISPEILAPLLAGYIVDDRDTTEDLLREFRKTVASTISKKFYGTFARLCEEEGVELTSQALLNIDADNVASRGYAHKSQGEFWAYQTDGNYDCLDATSAAHLYGLPISSAEAFSDTPYRKTWSELLQVANLAYCNGINEFVACASSHQPWPDRKYNDDDSKHPYIFHRLNPAWESSKPFWDYQSRCAMMLREGMPVVDLCVYIGEDPPLKTMTYKLPLMPEGYNFDVCTFDALVGLMSVRDGKIVTPGGMTYNALLIQDRTYISPEAEAKIEALKTQGALVVRCDKGEDVAERLAAAGLAPDAALASKNEPADRLCFYHRRTDDTDIYFFYNHSPHAYDSEVTLRASGEKTEAWNPLTLERQMVATGGKGNTCIRLRLAPHESLFYVLSR